MQRALESDVVVMLVAEPVGGVVVRGDLDERRRAAEKRHHPPAVRWRAVAGREPPRDGSSAHGAPDALDVGVVRSLHARSLDGGP